MTLGCNSVGQRSLICRRLKRPVPHPLTVPIYKAEVVKATPNLVELYARRILQLTHVADGLLVQACLFLCALAHVLERCLDLLNQRVQAWFGRGLALRNL